MISFSRDLSLTSAMLSLVFEVLFLIGVLFFRLTIISSADYYLGLHLQCLCRSEADSH